MAQFNTSIVNMEAGNAELINHIGDRTVRIYFNNEDFPETILLSYAELQDLIDLVDKIKQ